MRSTNKNSRSGFTLIELLLVISIIGMWASLIITGVNSIRIKARDAVRRADANTLNIAIYSYLFDSEEYPPTLGPDGKDLGTSDLSPDFIPFLVSSGYLSQGIAPPISPSDAGIHGLYLYVNPYSSTCAVCFGATYDVQHTCGIDPNPKAMLVMWYEGDNPPNTGYTYAGGTAYCFF